jgi:glutaredoxin-like protein NrdH
MTTVYIKPSCVQCDMTKKMLNNLGVEYNTVDITKDEDAFNLVVGMGFQSAPVVITASDSWSGFNPDKINSLSTV